MKQPQGNQLLNKKAKAIIALSLCLPVASIGTAVGMIYMPGTPFGKSFFFLCKLWLFILPLAWFLFIDKKRISISHLKSKGFANSALIGIIMSIFILGFYLLLGKRLIDPQELQTMAKEIGLTPEKIYIGGAIYWITVNSILEEYIWRWFVVSKCCQLMPHKAAIIVSALGFTIHHIIALQIYFSPLVVTLCSLGIFIGGATWSWCYIRYNSIWPGYLSHAIVDITVFVIGYQLIFP